MKKGPGNVPKILGLPMGVSFVNNAGKKIESSAMPVEAMGGSQAAGDT